MSRMIEPPHSVESERAVLGSILLCAEGRDGDRVFDICQAQGLTEGAFFDTRHRTVYAAMLELAKRRTPLEPATILTQLRESGTLESIGGAKFIEELIDCTPTTAYAEYHLGIVREHWKRRKLIAIAQQAERNAADTSNYPAAQFAIAELERQLLALDEDGAEQTISWASAVKAAVSSGKDTLVNGRSKTAGIETGVGGLDAKLQGLAPCTMTVIAARPSVGKTSLGMNIAECVALGRGLDGKPINGGERIAVAVFSLEMSTDELCKRMVNGVARVNGIQAAQRNYTTDEVQRGCERYEEAGLELETAPIHVDETPALDIADLASRARRLKRQQGIGLIIIDYLHLCTCRNASRLNSRQLEVAEISRQIKAMAKELKIPVIGLSQLSRANEKRGGTDIDTPRLSDLRDSGAIEQDADIAILLHSPYRPDGSGRTDDEKNKKLVIANVAKNRNGETGIVRLCFEREYTRFSNDQI